MSRIEQEQIIEIEELDENSWLLGPHHTVISWATLDEDNVPTHYNWVCSCDTEFTSEPMSSDDWDCYVEQDPGGFIKQFLDSLR